jgi:hypothetical protein
MKRKLLYWTAVLCASAALLAGAVPAHAASLTVYFNIRHSDGSWQGFQAPAQPPGGGETIADATDAQNDSTHVDIVNTDGLWDNVRYSNGTWQGWEQPPQPPGISDLSTLAEAGDRDGNIWFAIDTNDGLYYDYRQAGGSWGSWTLLVAPAGMINDLAVATDDVSYQVQVMAVEDNGTLWHNVYSLSSRSWQGWKEPAQVPGGTWSVAAAGEVSGNVQFIAMSNAGVVYHNIRYHDGSWQGWVKPAQPHFGPGFVAYSSKVAAAVDGDGNAQFTVSADTLYHTIRYVNGTWQGGWATPSSDGCGYNRLAVTTQTYRPGPYDFYFATFC